VYFTVFRRGIQVIPRILSFPGSFTQNVRIYSRVQGNDFQPTTPERMGKI